MKELKTIVLIIGILVMAISTTIFSSIIGNLMALESGESLIISIERK